MEVSIGDLDDVGVEITSSCLLELFDGIIFSDSGSGHRCRWVDLERREDFGFLLFADLGVLITIDSSNPEDTIILVDPFVKFLSEFLRLSIYLSN